MSNNKQQTAVDILCGKLAMKLGIPQAITFYIDHAEEIAEAKAMHKEEIIHAYSNGWHDGQDAIIMKIEHIDKGGDERGLKYYEQL